MKLLPKLFRFFVGFVAALFIIYTVLSYVAKAIPNHPYFDGTDFMVIAHRGGRSLGPENTIHTYRRAVELGVDVLEIDVHLTEDNDLAVIHDRTVDRTTNGSGPVDGYSMAELKKLDAAYRWSPDRSGTFPLRSKGIHIPSLTEVFTAFPQMRINIEIKVPESATVTRLCQTIREHDMNTRVLVASFDSGALEQFRSLCPEVATSAGASEAMLFYALQRASLESAYSPKAEALQVPENYGDLTVVDDDFLKASANRNMRVQVWTINDPISMQRLIRSGVNGIMTDDPEILLKVLREVKR
jgi:glycerophosphoryl diester phosphodiesterase